MPRSKQAVQEERAEIENYSAVTGLDYVPVPRRPADVISDHQEIQDSEWIVGVSNRGHGHGDYAVIVKGPSKEVVVKCSSREIAEHIVGAHKFLQLHDDVHCDVIDNAS